MSTPSPESLHQGNLLLIGEERAELEKRRADDAEAALEAERRRSQVMAERLRELGIDLDLA